MDRIGKYKLKYNDREIIVDTEKPDFHMTYKTATGGLSKWAGFCVIDKTPRLMPNPQNNKDVGYLCVPLQEIRKKKKYSIFLVQKKRIKYVLKDNTIRRKNVYIYKQIDRTEVKIIEKIS